MSQIEDDLNVAAYLERTGGNTPADYIIIRLAAEVRRLRADVDPAADNANELLKKLPAGHRLSVFAQFCRGCGGDNPKCRCWDDE